MLHLEMAEKYLSRANQEGDENLFTDIIYRTNHAFEGILKEAYTVLAQEESHRKTPNEIEIFLANNDIFKSRVLDQFTNYRTAWRNPSTHDHKLFFTGQEAFLAIVSVSAFINILLDQIIEKSSFEIERAETVSKSAEIKDSIESYDSLPLTEKVKNLLLQFSMHQFTDVINRSQISETQLVGMITGYIASVDPTLKIEKELLLSKSMGLRPDLVISKNDVSVIVEIKRAKPNEANIKMAENQLEAYLRHSGMRTGILFFFPRKNVKIIAEEWEQIRRKESFSIITIKPETYQKDG